MAEHSPIKPYTDVESDYIKERMKGVDFDDLERRKHINALIFIEHMLLEGPANLSEGRGWGMARNNMADEVDRIQLELQPEKYRERKKREQEEEKDRQLEQQKLDEQERAERQEDKRQWKELREQPD